MNILKIFAVVFLISSAASADWSKQCSSTWDPVGDENSPCVAQQITNGFAEAPSEEYMSRYTNRESCLSYCDIECTGKDSVVLCVQRKPNNVLKICREKSGLEKLGWPVPETKSSCKDVSVD